MEKWDAYDENFKIIQGVTLIRGEKVPEGMYHLTCEILVRHRDGTYLLMQRDEQKTYGGYWEATAGGSALQGETPQECALRELKEETGLTADRLTELGRVIHNEHQTIYAEFLAETDCDKSSVTLQKGETQAYKWVDAKTLKSMTWTALAARRVLVFIKELV